MVNRLSRFLASLPYFVAVAEELHFGRAADRLGLSQPPLSRRIRQLEREVGTALFLRAQHRVTLTDAGAMLLHSARAQLDTAEQVIQDVARTAKGIKGRLNVGFVSSALYSLLPPTVLEFGRRYPDVELSLQEMTTVAQITQLQHRKIDVGFLRSSGAEPSLRMVAALREPLMAIVHTAHPMAGRRRISIADLAEDSFVMYSRSNIPHLRHVVMRVCERAGFVPNIVQDANQIPTIMAFVSAGLGVALIPASARHCVVPGAACITLDEAVMVELEVGRLKSRVSPIAESFVEIACSVGQALASSNADDKGPKPSSARADRFGSRSVGRR